MSYPVDTHPDVEKHHIFLIRQANITQKMSLVRSLSRTMILLSRRAIARANPSLSEQDVDLLFVSHHYGQDLAQRLRAYLKNR